MRVSAGVSLPYLGCDSVPKTGQAWIRNPLLAATPGDPPHAGQAVDTLVTAIRTGALPPELTRVAPHCVPTLDVLEKSQFTKGPCSDREVIVASLAVVATALFYG